MYANELSSPSHSEHGIEATDQPMHGSREEIRMVAASHGATNVRLFGSRARGKAGMSSDVDLLVKLDPGRRNPEKGSGIRGAI